MQLLDALNLCTFVFAGGDAFEVDDAEVQPLLQPDAVHDADHLKGQHVLPQVLSHLKHNTGQITLQPPGGTVFR